MLLLNRLSYTGALRPYSYTGCHGRLPQLISLLKLQSVAVVSLAVVLRLQLHHVGLGLITADHGQLHAPEGALDLGTD
jgi:hypothetical protein